MKTTSFLVAASSPLPCPCPWWPRPDQPRNPSLRRRSAMGFAKAR